MFYPQPLLTVPFVRSRADSPVSGNSAISTRSSSDGSYSSGSSTRQLLTPAASISANATGSAHQQQANCVDSLLKTSMGDEAGSSSTAVAAAHV